MKFHYGSAMPARGDYNGTLQLCYDGQLRIWEGANLVVDNRVASSKNDRIILSTPNYKIISRIGENTGMGYDEVMVEVRY